MRTHILHSLIIAGAFALVAGCSDLKDTLPAATTGGVQVHPAGWTDPVSTDFHGKAVKAANWDLTSCQKCHSAKFDATGGGGISGVSCSRSGCHESATATNLDCTTCHGTANVNAAPPQDLSGNTSASAPGVGAHQPHLLAPSLGKTVACAECHKVPTSLADAGHIDSTAGAELIFGSLSKTATTGIAPSPSYTKANQSCAGSYCHGNFVNGNTTNAPTWTNTASAACGTCHGSTSGSTTAAKALPKTAANGGTHPPYTQCYWCHDQVVDANTAIIAKSKHIDGTVQVIAQTGAVDCSKCHGSATNAAPPKDLDGNTAVTSAGVGAHQVHLAGTTSSKSVACTECHVVPATLNAAGHIDTPTPAELIFGTLAKTATTGITPAPSYSFANRTCAGSYCHGNFANGNTTNAPTWNGAAGSGAACGTCHGSTSGATTALKALPKTAANGGTHPNYTQCSWCHDQVVNASTAIISNVKHVDGQVQLFQMSSQADCSRCHGNATNAAPPTDLSGNTATTAKGVGAHQAHLLSAGNGKPVKCAECHKVPSTLDYTGADGHIDLTTGAEVMFQDTLANLQTNSGASVPSPAYTSTTATCSNTYCHGVFKYGNATNTVTWTDPTTAACGTCHGTKATGNPLPTASGHPQTLPGALNCQNCHTVSGETAVATYNSTAGTWSITNVARHMNGKRNTFTTEGTY